MCIVFLYWILGWSAFVGLVVLLALFPVPGFVASKLASTQAGKMQAVSLSGMCFIISTELAGHAGRRADSNNH